MTENPNLPLETDDQTETVTPPQPASEPTVPPTEPTTPPVAPTINYEEKFAESTREAQILAAQLEQERQKNARKELTNEPTDSDLQAAFPEWEVMTDTEKKLARRTFATERIASSLHQKDQEREAAQRWNTDLELTIASKPALQGKEQAFKEFAKKPTHRGAPLDVLVSAFLHESSSNPSPAPASSPAPGLLSGNGGPRVTEKPKLLTGEELKTLRESDMKAYREYIQTHDVTQLEA